MKDFSIIVPVYNAEKTIERCLDSIQKQNYSNYEVIVIDDGSFDKSYQMCCEYQSIDERFRVYQQKNAGVSAARNKGLELAEGRWVCFVDSDDTISAKYLESLFETISAENPEVIFMGYIQRQDEKATVKLPGKSKEDYYKTLLKLSEDDMFGYTWIKCFKRECIGEVRFEENLNLFEDEVFTCEILAACKKVSLLNEPLYEYYTGMTESLTQKLHKDYCKKCDYVFKAWERLLKNEDTFSQNLKEKADVYVQRCHYYALERKVDIKNFYSELKHTRYFEVSDMENKFAKRVLQENYIALALEKICYNTKIKVAGMLGR